LESGVGKTPFQPATQKCVLHFWEWNAQQGHNIC
jgi:hypothetical protein